MMQRLTGGNGGNRPNHELVTFPTEEELAQGVAQRWQAELAAVPIGERRCMALAGGRIARRFLAVATVRFGRAAAFPHLHFFWGDERCVGPMDPESNYRLAFENFLGPLVWPASQVHRIRGEWAPAEAAAEAEATLRQIAPTDAAGVPVLDLVFLGMGEEGHVASLFPGAGPEVWEGPAVYVPVVAAKPPPRRITLTMPVLAAARQVWVLASGPGKAGALREALSGSGHSPMALLLARRQNTLIFTDYQLDGESPNW